MLSNNRERMKLNFRYIAIFSGLLFLVLHTCKATQQKKTRIVFPFLLISFVRLKHCAKLVLDALTYLANSFAAASQTHEQMALRETFPRF